MSDFARTLDFAKKLLLIGAGSAVVAISPAQAPAARPKFEVASIKPSPPGGPETPERWVREASLGRMRLEKFPVRALIEYAFGVRSSEISGGPAWTSQERYEIIAKAEKPVDEKAMRTMLQALLEDRFRLKLHHEKRELPIYNLVMAKRGKLPEPREGACVGSDPRIPPKLPVRGKRMLTACGGILMPLKPPARAELYGGKVTMAALVSRLTALLDRLVIDKTGFTGEFDLELQFALDDSLVGMGSRLTGIRGQPGVGATDPSGLPSIFTALREQLGLGLESAKGPVEVIVIDSVERPSAN